MFAVRLSVLLLTLALATVQAQAHAQLERATLSVGSTVAAAPSEVRMWFSQALEPRFTTAQLRASSGAVVATGGVDAADPKQIVIRLHALPAGTYKVFWKVLSVDSHRTEGSFGFEVKP